MRKGHGNILVAKTPLRVLWIQPQDVAPVAVFLASGAAGMVTGAIYDVTGGDKCPQCSVITARWVAVEPIPGCESYISWAS